MKIANKVIEKIRKSPRCKNRLAMELETHFTTVERWVRLNGKDGRLTTAKAVEVISEETKTPVEKILVA